MMVKHKKIIKWYIQIEKFTYLTTRKSENKSYRKIII